MSFLHNKAIWLIAFVLGLLQADGSLAAASHDSDHIRTLPKVYKTAKAINYSAYRAGGPNVGEVPSDAQILQDLCLLHKANYTLLRLFGADLTSTKILRLAQENYPKMKFQLGVFLAYNVDWADSVNNAQVDTAIALANQYKNVVTVSVGNETNYWGLPVSNLASYITRVRSHIKQPVTSDQLYFFYSGALSQDEDQDPNVILPLLDFVSMHAYPFQDLPWNWQQLTAPAGHKRAKAMMEAAFAFLKQNFYDVATHTYYANGKTQTIAQSLPIVMGETGWKSYATNPENAIEAYAANPVNQKWYFDLLKTWKGSKFTAPVTIFGFEAFDESWKGPDDGWGFWNSIRAANYVLCDTPAGKKCNHPLYKGAGYYPLLQNTNPSVTVYPNQHWVGFMTVSELPSHGGGFVFNSAWGTNELQATFTDTCPGKGVLVLRPNTNVWNPNDTFWVQPDGTPNKIMDARFYVQNDNLINKTVTFNGTCISNTLTVEPLTGILYESTAFIVAFDSNYNVLNSVSSDLFTGQPFSLTLDTTGATHVQYGFETVGPDADPATVDSLGSVVIAAQIH